MLHLINPYKKEILLTCLSALLVVLAFPKVGMSGLIWVALIPLFFVLHQKTSKQAAAFGFLLGTLISFGAFYWVIHTLREFGHLPYVVCGILFLLFALICNLHIALFTYLLNRFPIRLPLTLWVPLLYTLVEFFFPQIFHWYLGACLYKKLWIIQIADLTGVHGVTFLVVLVNIFIYELIRWIKKDTEIFPTLGLITTLLCLLFSIFYSSIRLRDLREAMKTSPSVKAALVQTNVGNLEKFESSKGYGYAVDRVRAINEELVLKAAKEKKLDLIVLPETAVPGYFSEDKPLNREIMFNLSSKASVPVFFGGYNKTLNTHPNQIKIYNSAFLISNYFQILGGYNKNNLLIFGEYLPFLGQFSFIKKLLPEIGDFSPGTKTEVMSLTKDLSLVPLICFEGLLPNFVRKFVKLGGRFIVTITNDSWFGNTPCPYQHLLLHVWRAIENRTPMLRCANTGVSAFIDLTGKIQSKTKIFKEAILIDTVSVINQHSFYTLYGNVFIYLLLLILSVLYIRNYYVK